MSRIEPAFFHCLSVERSAGIRRGERNLNGMRIYFSRKSNRLLDRFSRFARKAENEGSVNRNAQLMAVLGELPRHIDAHPFADIVKNLLVPGLVSDQQKPQPVVPHDLQGLPRDIGFGIAWPGHAE